MTGRTRPVLAIAGYEARSRARGTLTLTGLLSAFLLLFIAFFPSLQAAEIDWEAYVETMPPALREAMGIVTVATIEGFLAVEFYQFAWLLLLGLYLAYLGGELVAEDVETRRMDLTLAAPVHRTSVVAGKFLGLVPLVLVLNIVLPVVTYLGVTAIGEEIAAARLVGVHALAIPYLLTCVAIGLVFSVALDRSGLAQRAGLGLVFGLFMLDSMTGVSDYEWVGAISPTRHYDPTDVLVFAEYDLVGAAVLTAAVAGLVVVAGVVFRRRDLAG